MITPQLLWRREGKAKKALQLAKKAYQIAGDGVELGPAIAETQAQAQFLSGKILEALKGIHSASQLWPEESHLQTATKEIENRYVQAALQLIQEGKQKTGFTALEKGAPYSSLAAQTLCQALSKTGEGERALAQTTIWKARYPEVMSKIWGEVVAAESARLYAWFNAGKQAQTIQMAKVLHEKYAFDKELKKTYDKLFDTYINDDTAIVMAAIKPASDSASDTANINIERALASLYGGPTDVVSIDISVDQDNNIRQGQTQRPHGIAVIIGNQRYAARKKGLPDVKYASRDASVMVKYLVKTMGFAKENILLSLDATGSDLRVMFGTQEQPQGKLYNWVKAEKGRAEVFVYYVGHGAPAEKRNEAYLVPVNAEVNYIETIGYPLSLFYHNLEVLPAKLVMVVVDACFSGDSAGGQLFNDISPAMLRNVSPIQNLQNNSFVLCGAGENQVCAWYPEKRHSLMTYYFFEALQGKADMNGDHQVTTGELYDYISNNVSRKALRMGRDQNPLQRGRLDIVLVKFR